MQSGWVQQGSSFTFTVQPDHVGQRIDKCITSHFTQYSRSFLQKLFVQQLIKINQGKIVKPSYILRPGDTIFIQFPEEKTDNTPKEIPQDLNVSIIAKEQDFLIVDKPAGLVVHAPSENYDDVTLSDWITHTHQEIAHVGLVDRPGIVHRLDKDTSGLMIIPRTNHAHGTFTDMFKNRLIHKTYLAIVLGHPPSEGTIDFLIGRHPTVRNKMYHFTPTTKRASSRVAVTHFKVLEYFKEYSLVEIKPITGRTHQIRVHFAALGYPLLADYLYGAKSKLLNRHALHAHKLEFVYQDIAYSFTSPLASDLQSIINTLQPLKID
ncbi:RluA family pseudouridine synthase [Candidatus Babeliales bacterium]|nr:RluA family pseudouridine synthase [Candidatus Babeliales bacterium]